MNDEAKTVHLQVLGGGECPEGLRRGWVNLAGLPDHAHAILPNILAWVFQNAKDPKAAEFVARQAQEIRVQDQQLLEAVACCELLLRQASALDMEPDVLRQDMVLLNGGPGPVLDMVLSVLEQWKLFLRQEALVETLADHGKVMTGLNWRVDSINMSDRIANLNADVIYLSLQYREGEDKKKFQIQVTPDVMGTLRDFCNRFMSSPEE